MEAAHWNDILERRARSDDGPSLGDLLGRFTNEFSRLIRLEIQLAKTEATEKATAIGKGAGVVAAGAVVALVGLSILAMAIAFLIGTAMPLWAAFLVTAVLFMGIGGALLAAGMSRIKKTPTQLRRTMETIDEDKQWIRKEANDMKRDPAHLGHQQ